jgi:hypothetical protein
MTDFVVLERLEDGRLWIRFTVGALAGRTVMAFPESEPRIPPSRERRTNARVFLSPFEQADRLLRSLLTGEQATDWGVRRRFCVPSPFGKLEFGRVSDIGFWPKTGGEFRLCVLPDGKALPDPDIWTNLLFALKADPRWFFTVANWRKPNGNWNFGPVPGFETRN